MARLRFFQESANLKLIEGPDMSFPKRIYTQDEVSEAQNLIAKGYKHRLRIYGSSDFRLKTKKALELIKIAGYYDFLRTYIRSIKEIDGLTQLRQAEATIWANDYAVKDPVNAASTLIQKASLMKEYIEGKIYYGGAAERRSDQKRVDFLRTLRKNTKEKNVAEKCDELLEMWRESSLVY